jgi:hypothetical protein
MEKVLSKTSESTTQRNHQLHYRKFKSVMTQNSCQLGFMVVLLKLKRLTFVLATPKLGEMYNDICCSKICLGTF